MYHIRIEKNFNVPFFATFLGVDFDVDFFTCVFFKVQC